MNKIVNVLKKYMYVVAIFIVMSIILSVTYSNFIVTSNNHKAAEMYIGALKYSIEIEGNITNTLSVPTGETIIDVKVNNLNPVDTYYKLLYLKNSNLTVEYFSSAYDLDDSNNITKSYDKPNDSVTSSNTKTIKLQITNNGTSSQTLSMSVKGGYITNTLSDIAVPSTYSEIASINTKASTYFCTTANILEQGEEYVNGQYTYRYMQEGAYTSSSLAWDYVVNNGWGVQLTDKTSTDTVTTKLCNYINNVPITSMSYMFYKSQAASIDLTSFNTSKVINMKAMFSNTIAKTLDLSGFDTSKVITMQIMFVNSKVSILDLSNFNTSNVTNMNGIFYGSQATILELSSFDTSNVTNMTNMFRDSQVTTLDLSNFDTRNVIEMLYMFSNTQIKTIKGLENFDTSNVTNMQNMFQGIKATSLDLSGFDTSKVTNMNYMFLGNTNLKTIYVNNKFKIDNVTSSTSMFKNCTNLTGGAGTTYDASHTDKEYAHIDGGTSNPGYFTDVADKDIPEPSSFATDSWKTIIKAVRNNNISKYNVGDTRTIDLGDYGTHTLRLSNTSTPSECSNTGFSQTACGFVIEFADIITTHKMNDTDTNISGWPVTSMRTFVNNDIYNVLPSDLQVGIAETTVVSSHSRGDSSNFTSKDKLYLLSSGEIYAEGMRNKLGNNDTSRTSTRQLDYYKNSNTNTSSFKAAIKKNGTTASPWWHRSAYSTYERFFISTRADGGWSSLEANIGSGVSPAFRIG